jgi:hypothetical protein
LAVDVLVAAGKFLQRGSPAPERLGTGRVDLEDDGAAEGRFLGKHREKRPQPDGDAGERIALSSLVERLRDAPEHGRDAGVVEGEEAALLVTEMLVEGLARHSGERNDVCDLGLALAVLRDGPRHPVEHASALGREHHLTR